MGPIKTETDFSEQFGNVTDSIDHPKIKGIWREYLETCIAPDFNDPKLSDKPKRVLNTFRPQEFFNLESVFPANAWESAVPNLFVGFGLVVTFMGLVAALDTAADTIDDLPATR